MNLSIEGHYSNLNYIDEVLGWVEIGNGVCS